MAVHDVPNSQVCLEGCKMLQLLTPQTHGRNRCKIVMRVGNAVKGIISKCKKHLCTRVPNEFVFGWRVQKDPKVRIACLASCQDIQRRTCNVSEEVHVTQSIRFLTPFCQSCSRTIPKSNMIQFFTKGFSQFKAFQFLFRIRFSYRAKWAQRTASHFCPVCAS